MAVRLADARRGPLVTAVCLTPVAPHPHRVRRPADGGPRAGATLRFMSTERVYKPRWHCKLHLYPRWRTYRSDTGKDSGNPDYGERDNRDLYQECLDCGKYRDRPDARAFGG